MEKGICALCKEKTEDEYLYYAAEVERSADPQGGNSEEYYKNIVQQKGCLCRKCRRKLYRVRALFSVVLWVIAAVLIALGAFLGEFWKSQIAISFVYPLIFFSAIGIIVIGIILLIPPKGDAFLVDILNDQNKDENIKCLTEKDLARMKKADRLK